MDDRVGVFRRSDLHLVGGILTLEILVKTECNLFVIVHNVVSDGGHTHVFLDYFD